MPADGGVTVTVAPVPTAVPLPQPLLYHFQSAPVPKLPPVILKVVLPPLQMVVAEALALVAGIEVSLTVMETLAQLVLLHNPSALTKYVCTPAAVGETVTLVPVPIEVPLPQPPLYHFQLAP